MPPPTHNQPCACMRVHVPVCAQSPPEFRLTLCIRLGAAQPLADLPASWPLWVMLLSTWGAAPGGLPTPFLLRPSILPSCFFNCVASTLDTTWTEGFSHTLSHPPQQELSEFIVSCWWCFDYQQQ